MVRVKWTRPAVDDLHEIVRFISKDNPRAARALARKLKEATRSLRAHPHLGRAVPETDHESIRELIRGSYRVIYRCSGEQVQILTAMEGRRVLPVTNESTPRP